MLVAVLAWASAILGLFITYNILAPSAPPCQYNVGCYLVPHSLNHTAEIHTRIAALKSLRQPILYQHKSISSDGAAFQKQVMNVAQSFQKYIQQLAEQQKVRIKDKQILQAISLAQQSYFNCKHEIEQTFDGGQCNQTWNSYLNCFQEVKKARDRIEFLLTNQKELQAQISQEIQEPQDDPTKKPEFLAELAYNQSIRQNQASIRGIREQISDVELKISRFRKQKDEAQDRVQTKQRTYRQCWQNRRNFNQCEEIAQQVKSISTGFLEQLKQQLQAKMRLMQEMMDMMIRMGKGQNRKMPQHWNEMYQKHREQYKRMHNDYINNTLKEGKACGCTEQEESYLESEVQKERQIIENAISMIQKLNVDIDDLKTRLLEKEQERQRIIAIYQQSLKEYAINEPDIKETNLIKLKKRLEHNRQNILNVKDQFNRIDGECKAIKKKLAESIKDIDRVEQCIGKKEYFLKLKAETAKFLHPQRSLAKVKASRKELAQALTSFEL